MPTGDELLCGTMAVVRREASASARTVVVGDSSVNKFDAIVK